MYQARIDTELLEERPGAGLLFFGTLFPLGVILFELVTGMCASTFFDPLPTWAHIALALAVPAANFALWLTLRGDAAIDSRWLMLAGGAASAIAAAYTLVFLPLLPVAVIGILFFGLGFLPYGPIAAMWVSIKQTKRLYWTIGGQGARRAWIGAALGLLAILAADLPATATLLALRWSQGDGASTARGVSLMRTLGDRDMLLRLSYEGDRRATGLGSALVSLWDSPFFSDTVDRGVGTDDARELYYRVTGEPFNLRAPPYARGAWDRFNDFEFDADQGGTQVGGLLRGLGLAASRIDGSVSAPDALAYLEWTMTFSNTSEQQREARMTLALPPGAVATRATLWVNDEPREAVIAGRAETRAAYEQVVVRERRDPLLVTTDGADRLLVQAFPIQPGATLKLRIGLTAPLEIGPDRRMSLALPAITDRNFAVEKTAPHLVWVESKTPLTEAHAALSLTAPGQVRGELGDASLAAARPRIFAGLATPGARAATLPAKGKEPAVTVSQTIAPMPSTPAAALMLVVDGSKTGAAARDGLIAALGAVPAGAKVGLTIAGDRPTSVAPAAWSPAQRERFAAALRDHDFVGGQDNAAALASAPGQLDARGALLWVHGPQPVAFAASSARLEQLGERAASLPRLLLYQVAPGPQRVLAGSAWAERAETVTASGAVERDLSGVIRALLTAEPRLRATRVTGAGATEGSPHIARLWAAEEIERLDAAGKRDAAIALAARARVITPVSGAVVLETDADYTRNGLAVPEAGDVPTVPEPEIWALLLIALLAAGWFFWRRRTQRAIA